MTSTTLAPEKAPEVTVESRELLLSDRCDRCRSAAYYRAWKIMEEGVFELLFCGHHGRTHTPALKDQGFEIDDQSAKLFKNTKPMSGSNMGD